MKFAIIGRETNLARAELESLADDYTHVNNEVSLFNTPSERFDLDRVGGMIKFGEVHQVVEIDCENISSAITNVIFNSLKNASGKVTFGISNYLSKNLLSNADLYKISKAIKKLFADKSIPSRFIKPAQQQRLSAAEIIYNRLTRENSADWVLFDSQDKLYIGRTLAVQDINSYSLRDRGRPARDARVGMLPPKLAQIMINLAKPDVNDIVVDPFCGSGVICAEAMLTGRDARGADISDKMVKASRQNLTWLTEKYSLQTNFQIDLADATTSLKIPSSSVLVSETYLGPPMSGQPSTEQINTIKQQISQTILKFLLQLTKQSQSGYRATISLPFWHSRGNNYYLDILDQIHQMGYTIKQFSTSKPEELLYRRPEQVVGRQILVLIRS